MEVITYLLLFCAGLGVFMYGMKVMGDNLERSAGSKIQGLFDKVTNNKLLGVGIGCGATAIVQSSSATTVMVLGFVNAGIMSLYQATTIIMGANIGTTITAFIVSLKALPISSIFMAFALVGAFILMFSKSDKFKLAGGIFIGLGLIFIGLDVMSTNMEFLRENKTFIKVFETIRNPFVLFIVGALFTALIQSSSAASSIVITMVLTQVLPISSGLYIILGTNLGTCITAFMASIGATRNGLRTAFIHLMFNMIGAIIFFPILLIFESPIMNVLNKVSSPAMAIAYFHLTFNVATTIILLPWTKYFVMAVEKLIPNKANENNSEKMEFVDERLLATPSVAVAQLGKEVFAMGLLAKENLIKGVYALQTGNVEAQSSVFKAEERIDFLTNAITDFAVKLSSTHLSDSDEQEISGAMHIVTDMERIGDHAVNLMEYAVDLSKRKKTLHESEIADLATMSTAVTDMLDLCEQYALSKDKAIYDKLYSIEEAVDDMKKEFTTKHIARITANISEVDTEAVYFGVITDLERVADHITNIVDSLDPIVLAKRMSIKNRIKESIQKAE